MDTPYAIEMLHITKRFPGIIANDDITLQVKKGEIHALLGENGAGKSTLVRCLNFLERPTEGTVYVEGQDLSTLDAKQLRQLRKHVAMIFQNFNLLMQRTVLDNVCFPMEIAGVDKKTAREKAREFLKVVELSDKHIRHSCPADRSSE